MNENYIPEVGHVIKLTVSFMNTVGEDFEEAFGPELINLDDCYRIEKIDFKSPDNTIETYKWGITALRHIPTDTYLDVTMDNFHISDYWCFIGDFNRFDFEVQNDSTQATD